MLRRLGVRPALDGDAAGAASETASRCGADQGAPANAPDVRQQVAQFAVRTRRSAWGRLGRPVCRGARLLSRSGVCTCAVRSLRRAPLASVPARHSLAAKQRRVSAGGVCARGSKVQAQRKTPGVFRRRVPCSRPYSGRDRAARQQVAPQQRRGLLRLLQRRKISQQGYAATGCG